MSNTGQKGITYLPDQGVYKITVGWRGKVVTRYLRGKHPKDLKKAVGMRNQVEKKLGKPRTDEVLRSFGYAQGQAWKRSGKKIVKTRRRRR
ncbi:MAG TPA: hypothetical protein VK449_10825 [Anaerolineales bacterium]|nr:hypothetical protein [Anaerolineales bacterium]